MCNAEENDAIIEVAVSKVERIISKENIFNNNNF